MDLGLEDRATGAGLKVDSSLGKAPPVQLPSATRDLRQEDMSLGSQVGEEIGRLFEILRQLEGEFSGFPRFPWSCAKGLACLLEREECEREAV